MVYRLETERLRLREWLPEDREPLAAMNADRRVMEFFPHPLSRAESDAFFDRIVAEWAESGRGLYAVERRGDGRLIGLTGLHDAFGRVGLPRVYSFTAAVNLRSERVMRRLGMRNLGGFDHPALPVGHLLRRHVLYAAARDTFEGRFFVRP